MGAPKNGGDRCGFCRADVTEVACCETRYRYYGNIGKAVYPVGGWRPIATAPRDGTRIDLWMVGPEDPDGYRALDASWEHGRWEGDHPDDVATHWMPSPPAPSHA